MRAKKELITVKCMSQDIGTQDANSVMKDSLLLQIKEGALNLLSNVRTTDFLFIFISTFVVNNARKYNITQRKEVKSTKRIRKQET